MTLQSKMQSEYCEKQLRHSNSEKVCGTMQYYVKRKIYLWFFPLT